MDEEERKESSMMEIVNAEYREIENLDSKSTEELTAKTNTLYQQMQMIGAMGIQVAAEAGRCLTVIKERVGHGNWEDWCKMNLQFSERKARRMMKLASEMENPESVFANRTTLSDIEISKIYALLAAPEEVQKAVLDDPKMEEASVREFQDEIKRLKAELAAERAKEEVDNSAEELAAAEQKIEELSAQVKILQEGKTKAEWEREVEDLQKKIEAEAQKAKEAARKLKEAKAAAAAEAEKAAEVAAEKAKEDARAEAKAEVEKETAKLAGEVSAARAEIEKLNKKLENSTAAEIVEFKVKADQLQKDFQGCMKCIEDMYGKDLGQASRMAAALKQVMQAMITEAENAES